MLFVAVGMKLSLVTITLGHGTALISVATTEIFAGLQKLERAQEEASLDLGANQWRTFWRITLPNLRVSLIAAGLLIFTLVARRNRRQLLPHRARQHFAAGDLVPPAPRNHSGDQCHLDTDFAFFHRHDSDLVPVADQSAAHGRFRRGAACGSPRRRDPLTESRRDFLKFIVAGSVAAGCPIDLSLLSAENEPQPEITGDHYEICHEVRDDHKFPRPPVSKKHDIIIVGGGASGLSAAYFLRDHDFLLLEKEPHWGGNATLEEYQGQAFATGSAFDYKGTPSEQLARELGLNPLPINSPDPTIVNGKWVADTWGAGLDELPYSAEVRASFQKFRSDMLKLAAE